MPTQCRLIELKEGVTPRPGDMWINPQILKDEDIFNFYKKNILSPEYFRDWHEKRPPITICLPNGHHWEIDSRFGGGPDGQRKQNGWTVTGELPTLTAMPSINSLGPNGYHGWLKDGVLSDDLEGRKY
jgi:hypothetical protein